MSGTAVGRDSSVTIATTLRDGRSGGRISVVARFSAPVQNGPRSTQHPSQWAPVLFRGLKRTGRGVDHPPHLAPRLKKVRAIPLLPPSGPSWLFLGRPLPLPLSGTAIFAVGNSITRMYNHASIAFRTRDLSAEETHQVTFRILVKRPLVERWQETGAPAASWGVVLRYLASLYRQCRHVAAEHWHLHVFFQRAQPVSGEVANTT